MSKQFFSIILFLVTFSVYGQFYKPNDNYPNFSISGGATYLIDSKDFGSHLRFCLPTQSGVNIYLQGNLMYPREFRYLEYRAEFAMELTFLKVGNLSAFAVGGFNWGYWKMLDTLASSYHYDILHKDRSYMVGGGLHYDFSEKWGLYSTYKAYPEIHNSYAELGFKYNYYYKRKPGKRKGRVAKVIK